MIPPWFCITTLTCAQVHLQSEGGKVGGGGGKAAAPAAATAGKKGAPVGASTAPLDEEGALRIIQAVITGKPDKAVAEQQLRDAVAKVRLGQSLMNDTERSLPNNLVRSLLYLTLNPLNAGRSQPGGLCQGRQPQASGQGCLGRCSA